MKVLIVLLFAMLYSTDAFAQYCEKDCYSSQVNMPETFEIRHGLDVFISPKTSLYSLHSISVTKEFHPNLYFGQSLYSAVSGDAGGLFVGGFELSKKSRIKNNKHFEVGGFVGGGGGASLVPGDGMMSKVFINMKQKLFSDYSGSIGLSFVNITGSNVSAAGLNFSVSKSKHYAMSFGHLDRQVNSGRVLVSFKPIVKQFLSNGNLKRSGPVLNKMYLTGIEAVFSQRPRSLSESFVQTTGAIHGDGEGYADIQFGYRIKTSQVGFTGFMETAVGFGGGGDVDTGGGLLGSLGVGMSVPILFGSELELGFQKIKSLDGAFDALSPFIKTSINFNKKEKAYKEKRSWQLSIGLSNQLANNDYRKPGNNNNNSPTLIENSIDLFLTKKTYFSGNAQTVIAGDAGGYAIGLLGIGYAEPLNDYFTVAFEGKFGAAGGGGVDTNGGIVGAVNLELDYNIKDNLALSFGFGQMQNLHGKDGANPVTIHLGLKTNFVTYH
ncbi:hypothetical protein OAD94_07675 [Amylibacter sp.]|nr:hypothetical protein [Amylibacter sp.]